MKILGLLLAFEVIRSQVLGPSGSLLDPGKRVAEATSRTAAEAGAREGDGDAVALALGDLSARIDGLRCEFEQSVEALGARFAEDRAELERQLGERTAEYADALLDRLREEEGRISVELARLQVRSDAIARIARAAERDPAAMQRSMILPTVQLRGNGTVGSGVLVYSEPQFDLGAKGPPPHATFVLTAYHVVAEVLGDRFDRGTIDEVHVLRPDLPETTRTFSARLVLFDRRRDLALLRLDTAEKFVQVARWRPRSGLSEIDVFRQAYAVGCPLGNRPLPTLGEISSKSKTVGDQVFWMLSAPIYFGNSGGGVFLADTYELIGVSSMIYTYGKSNPVVVPHLGLFVPLEAVYEWLDSEGYAFVHAKEPIPSEKLWKLVYRSGAWPVPAAAPKGE
ncbi:MAG: trypsin-like peptidase domain-containing protein [Planctomycetota bacterium]